MKLSGQNGMVLVVALLLLSVMLVIAFSAIMTTSTDLKMTGHFRANKKAFYLAEAGLEEARARMRVGASNPITDNYPTQTSWATYIGSENRAQQKGYNCGNAMHTLVSSDQASMGYVVRIAHQTDGAGGILYWGDADRDGVYERTTSSGSAMRNIYVVTSEGTHAGSSRIIEAEITRMPPVNVPAALTVNASTTVKGSSTHIIGTDACGGNDLSGISSSNAPGSITLSGDPNITGVPEITYSGTVINVQNLIDTYKKAADFTYTVNNATHTASTTPGPGDGWGTPTAGATLQSPSSCSVRHIVYYNTGGTGIQLSGGVSGCGMLLVEGDLKLSGGFSWYGPVITTGSLSILGGGNKNITGGILSGGSTTNAEDTIGGNTNIVYCSQAMNSQTDSMSIQVLSWMDKTSP